ncbi:2-dehydro-3-deoxygluconokinase [Cupriavidus yeoncheonensis]|uniref:2-dehydro-3-deoxygluconokinase n=1 Tax=Cupriavidus yeoncheonensis TaxID=1462994 RepID=A0A916N390_9BURK|nr:sugar kinase [Cupriavidus yeoncheonensis]CAG2134949.1 2-dehydro-3-deoxygluconokinase [Cupriavidus yeoncheonensis]
MSIDILAYGEPLVEFNQQPDDPTRYLQGFGGDTSNFCIAAARQGATTGYITAVGADAFGERLMALWTHERVDTRHVRVDPVAPTGVYFVSHDSHGHRFDYLREGSAAARYHHEQLPLAAIAQAKFLHLSGISLAISTSACDAGLAAMEHARKAGVKVSLDTNLRLRLWSLARARAIMREAFSFTEVCLPSWDDITVLTGLDDRDAVVDYLLGCGVGLVALKLGEEGAYVATTESRTLVQPFAVQPVDATGAGDCFGGSFIARLAAGADPFEAARYANVAAALSTTGYGAVAPIPSADTVLARLAQSVSVIA